MLQRSMRNWSKATSPVKQMPILVRSLAQIAAGKRHPWKRMTPFLSNSCPVSALAPTVHHLTISESSMLTPDLAFCLGLLNGCDQIRVTATLWAGRPFTSWQFRTLECLFIRLQEWCSQRWLCASMPSVLPMTHPVRLQSEWFCFKPALVPKLFRTCGFPLGATRTSATSVSSSPPASSRTTSHK